MYTELKRKLVKIKKIRRCFGCLRQFPIGAKMDYWVSVYDGDFSTIYHCQSCIEYLELSNFDELESGWMIEEMQSRRATNLKVEEFVNLRMAEIIFRRNIIDV